VCHGPLVGVSRQYRSQQQVALAVHVSLDKLVWHDLEPQGRICMVSEWAAVSAEKHNWFQYIAGTCKGGVASRELECSAASPPKTGSIDYGVKS
jgi:hypothetical protein